MIVHDISWCLSPISVDLPSPLVMRIMHCNLTSISSRSVRQCITLRTFLQDSSCRIGNFWSLTWCSCSSFISIDCLIRQNPMRAMTAIWFTTHIKGKNGDTFHYVHKLKVAPPLLPLACKTSHIAWKKWHVSFLVDTSNDVIASEYTWIEMHAYHKTRHRRAIDSYRFNDSGSRDCASTSRAIWHPFIPPILRFSFYRMLIEWGKEERQKTDNPDKARVSRIDLKDPAPKFGASLFYFFLKSFSPQIE